jgi:ABC-type uncharacterized transport system substrate-binding protein
VRRRTFIKLIGGPVVAWPLAARAQERVPRIGVLLIGGPELMGPYRTALRELGYVEGRNIQIEIRSAQDQPGRLPELAAELVRSKVDIIVASTTPAVTAARRATSEIPIVMAPAGDPVEIGFVSSLARPGGNITGVSGSAPELAAKILELIRELMPLARRLGYLSNANDALSRLVLEQIQQAAQQTNFIVHPISIRSNYEMAAAFAAMAGERADAIILSATLPIQTQVELALTHRIPSLHGQAFAAHSGALISYSASYEERSRQIADYVDKILKGVKPADLPVQLPSRFHLVINLKTAKAIGLEVPPTLLARADEVIE